MANLAIIPARGGSKRIPRKNIKEFLGKPIIAYSIESALESKIFDEVIVSTDDQEIADIAKQYGANVPFFRSEENANDFATTAAVIHEVLENYSKLGKTFDIACCIYPTAPFITKEALIGSIDMLKKGFDTVFPVVRYSYPIQRALKVDEQGKMSMFQPENLNARSQDLEASYHDAGQFYSFKVSSFLNTGKLWTDNTGVIELNELQVQDIDNIEDWKLAELKYKMSHEIQ